MVSPRGLLSHVSTTLGIFWILLVSTHSFVHPTSSNRILSTTSPAVRASVTLRGGNQEATAEALDIDTAESSDSTPASGKPVAALMLPMASSFAKFYADSMTARPIVTKSVTACGIFALSDLLAQRFERQKSSTEPYDRTRALTSAAVGLFYFGPAAHYWYDWVFRILPGTSLISTLQKAALGQMFFGPSFTCIFFATSLWQGGDFTLKNWWRKIRQDLPGAWLSGACFWPLVDLVSYQFITKDYIPLFVNMCSLVWTIYLSTIANRSASGGSKSS